VRIPDRAVVAHHEDALEELSLGLREGAIAGLPTEDRVMVRIHIGEIVLARRDAALELGYIGRGAELDLEAAAASQVIEDGRPESGQLAGRLLGNHTEGQDLPRGNGLFRRSGRRNDQRQKQQQSRREPD